MKVKVYLNAFFHSGHSFFRRAILNVLVLLSLCKCLAMISGTAGALSYIVTVFHKMLQTIIYLKQTVVRAFLPFASSLLEKSSTIRRVLSSEKILNASCSSGHNLVIFFIVNETNKCEDSLDTHSLTGEAKLPHHII